MRDRTNYNMLLGNDRFRMFYFLLCLGGKLQASLLKMTQADTELLGAILVYSPLKKKKILYSFGELLGVLKMKVHKHGRGDQLRQIE